MLNCSMVTRSGTCHGYPLHKLAKTSLSIMATLIVDSYFPMFSPILYLPFSTRLVKVASNALQKLVSCPFH